MRTAKTDDEWNRRALVELLARVAAMYYMDNMTQQAIAHELGLSRPKVQRLLQRARQEGIVEIRIHALPLLNLDLEAQLKATFRLKDAMVAAAHPDPQAQRESVARTAASFLERQLHNGLVIAVGMGRNTGEVPNFFNSHRHIDCTFVSAMGGSPRVDAPINPNEICRRLAAQCGGRAESLYAPAYVESAEVRDKLLQQEAVCHTLHTAAQANIALVGIGGTDAACTLVRSGCFSVEEVRQLRDDSAVGDILGNYFDVHGQMIPSNLYGRLVGLTMDDLRRIETVIAVVSEADKSMAILGALRSGVIDMLVVDAGNAQAVLQFTSAGGPDA
jgi:DNA-binding transcriptional regulator LsrR (DeoR family)